jgi:hypothetical protein
LDAFDGLELAGDWSFSVQDTFGDPASDVTAWELDIEWN